MKRVIKALKKLLDKSVFLYNQPLKEYCSFKIGGRARFILQAHDLEEIVKIVTICKRYNVQPFLLGLGTNLLIDDAGYNGIIVQLKGWFSEVSVKGNIVTAGAGASLNQVVKVAHQHNLSGLTDAYGIPGSVGGAVYMNASAYSFETASVVSSVLALIDGKITRLTPEQCAFGYRSSAFQENGGIVLMVEYTLAPSPQPLNHAELAAAVMQKRHASQPLNMPSAGSIFKKHGDISAGKIIDELGLKGLSVGGAKVSSKHANFIVNTGTATASDVLVLIRLIKQKVAAAHEIHLACEVKYLSSKATGCVEIS